MLVTLFAAVALIITAAGIAGVVSFSVNQRTTEIGVRMALGAPRSSVVRMIVRQGLTPVTLGLAAGLVLALGMTRIVARMLFGVEATDPMTYLDYAGERSFQDQTASCGEDAPRPCGIDAYVCSQKQNSVQLLASRLGLRGTGAPDASGTTTTAEPEVGGCQTSGSAGAPLALALAGLLRRRRRQRA